MPQVVEVLLVSEAKLKSYSMLNMNIDPQLLKPFILISQDLWLQPYLGSSYYEELKTQVSTQTLTATNLDFINSHISQALINYAVWKALPFLHTQIYNKGLMRPTSETGVAVDINDMKYLRQEILNTSESYAQKMINYLRERPSLFPTYFNSQVNIGDGILPEKGKISTNQFVIPKKYKVINGDQWNNEYGCDGCWERNAPRP